MYSSKFWRGVDKERVEMRAVRRPWSCGRARNNALCPRPVGMHTEIRVARAIGVRVGGEGAPQHTGPGWRTNQGRSSDNPQPPVVMEMWPLCYVHHTAPPALFRVHLGLGQDGGRPPDHRVHTLPFAAKPLNGYSGASHFFTLPASYVVGGTRYGVAAVRGLKTDNSSLAGFSVIVSFCILFLWPPSGLFNL